MRGRAAVWEGLAVAASPGQVFEVEAMIDGAIRSLQTQEGLGWREGSPKQ